VARGGSKKAFDLRLEGTFVEKEGKLLPRIVEATDPHWGRSIGTSDLQHGFAPLYRVVPGEGGRELTPGGLETHRSPELSLT
jgi:hypothetical protein